MADWRQQLDTFLKSQGYEKKAPELSAEDEKLIQQFIDNIGKPAFENISDQLNFYKEVKAEVELLPKQVNSEIEAYKLTLFKNNQPKLAYRLRFSKNDKNIQALGEFSIPNIYGETTRFQQSDLRQNLSATTEDEIANDFFKVLEAKFI